MKVSFLLRGDRGARRTSLLASVVASLVAFMPMTAVVPAQAAPTIQQGEQIFGGNRGGHCSLSIASPTTAYTALHCVAGRGVGGKVIAMSGAGAIGRLSALGSDLPQGKQLDVAKVDLLPGVIVQGYAGVGDSAKLKSGDPVQFKAPGNNGQGVIVDPNPTWYALGSDGKFPSFLITADIQTVKGNSGGALLDPQGNLLGVLAGGDGQNRSYYTPINEIKALLG